ncbi:hypothetical protein PFISCL1PPCAC_25830, partial [Pristionchus fissidentatus]
LCERDHRTIPSLNFRKSLAEHANTHENCVGKLDFERIWVKNPFRSNLAPPILNTIGEMYRKNGWKFTDRSLYNSMLIEEPPEGCEQHPNITRCLATSHIYTTRLATIDFIKEGVPVWILDHIRPRIVIREFVVPRSGYAARYRMRVIANLPKEMNSHVRDADDHVDSCDFPSVWREEEREWPHWTHESKWEQVEICLEDYPAGIRTISVTSGGKDTQSTDYAEEYNGVKIANLEIHLEMPNVVRWL